MPEVENRLGGREEDKLYIDERDGKCRFCENYKHCPETEKSRGVRCIQWKRHRKKKPEEVPERDRAVD